MPSVISVDRIAPLISREELIRVIETLTKPLPLDSLVKRGILRKVGCWYLITGTVPDDVLARANSVKDTKHGACIKFAKTPQDLHRLLKRLRSSSGG